MNTATTTTDSAHPFSPILPRINADTDEERYAWASRLCRSVRGAEGALPSDLSAQIEPFLGCTQEEAFRVIASLRSLSELSGWIPTRELPGAFNWGRCLFPFTPTGHQFMRETRNRFSALLDPELIEHGSELKKAIQSVELSHGSFVVSSAPGITTPTSTHNETPYLSFNVGVSVPVIRALPKGERPNPLAVNAVGREIDDVQSLADEMGMCQTGVRAFLDAFSISYEVECGECFACGCESSHDPDVSTLRRVDSFTLTEEMIRHIDGEGFATELADTLGGELSEQWEALASSILSEGIPLALDDRAPLSELADENKGVRYDPERWAFIPAFDELPGIDDIESDDSTALLPFLGMLCARFEAHSKLPPIPGTLIWKDGEGPRKLVSTRAFAWDPETGTLSHAISSESVSVLHFTTTGETRIRFPESYADTTIKLPEPGSAPARVWSGWTLQTIKLSVISGGSTLCDLAMLAQNKPNL